MKNTFFIFCLAFLVTACIGDDIIMDEVDEQLRIISMPSTIVEGETFQLEARFTNNVGLTIEGRVEWSSSDETILSIDPSGLATALEPGETTITASVPLDGEPALIETVLVEVTSSASGDTTTVAEVVNASRSGTIQTTTFYTLEGSFTLEEDGDKLILNIGEDYETTSALPGLYLYLTNNPNSTNGGVSLGEVTVFEGAHTYEIEGVGLNDFDFLLYFCKPFRVKVGDGQIE